MVGSVKKILVIEDEHFLLNFWEAKLDSLYYQVFKSLDGAKGLVLARSKSPDLILLDILMPRLDGYEVLIRLKKSKKTKDIPVIILSNLSQQEEIEKGIRLGAIDFIVKADVIPSEVETKIEKYLKINKK